MADRPALLASEIWLEKVRPDSAPSLLVAFELAGLPADAEPNQGRAFTAELAGPCGETIGYAEFGFPERLHRWILPRAGWFHVKPFGVDGVNQMV